MVADLFTPHTAPVSAEAADPAFAARPRLVRLLDSLTRAARRAQRVRWNEPPTFFFDPRRQAQLEAVSPTPLPTHLAEPAAHIAAELPALLASVEVRRVARALGLPDAARALAPHFPAARALADLLAVPDDEVFLALAPTGRTGIRLHVRGAADVAQLYKLLAPTVTEHPFQLFAPSALQVDGTLPSGFSGCENWLWPTQPLAAVPRRSGERVVLVGPAVVRPALDGEPRFPALVVACEVIQTLDAVQTTEILSDLCGAPLSVPAPPGASAVARAA
jgi:hypothetical protein